MNSYGTVIIYLYDFLYYVCGMLFRIHGIYSVLKYKLLAYFVGFRPRYKNTTIL